MSSIGDHQPVRLSVLLSRELANEKIEKPEITHSEASHFIVKKERTSHFIRQNVRDCLQIFDGHNGSAAAIYSKENLLNNVISAIPPDLNRDEWLAALPRALVAGFVKTDKDFQEIGMFLLRIGYFVCYSIHTHWADLKNSRNHHNLLGGGLALIFLCSYLLFHFRCVLEVVEGGIYQLSADHRLDESEEERNRITASGGEVGRLNAGGGSEIGPLRCWPGGLCLSRSIGDMDVGEFIVPVPYVKQIKLSTAGGRLIVSSDGVWDALTPEKAFECCRGVPPETAAEQLVKEAVQTKGLRDDTTSIVIDVLPPEKDSAPLPPPKKQGKGVFKSMFRKKSTETVSDAEKDHYDQGIVEELFEEGSAMLSERLETKYPLCNMFKLFMCAVCQVEMKPGEGISIHASSSNPDKARPWDGPFLCASCQDKKDAMEGKRPSGPERYLSDDSD